MQEPGKDEANKLPIEELKREDVVVEQAKEEPRPESKLEQIQENLKKLIEEAPKEQEDIQMKANEQLDQFISNPTILPFVPPLDSGAHSQTTEDISRALFNVEDDKRIINTDIVIKEEPRIAEERVDLVMSEVKEDKSKLPERELSFYESNSLELLPKVKSKLIETEAQTDEDFEARIMAELDPKINSLISVRLELLKKKVTEKIYASVYTAISNNIVGLISKHMGSLKEVLKNNIQQTISKSIDTTKIQNQINIIHKDLQDNIMFILQKIFAASFETSCEKMTKEVTRVYNEGIAMFKQKMEAEENLFMEQRKRSEEIAKRDVELIDSLQVIANNQLVSLEKACEIVKVKAETLLNPPQEKVQEQKFQEYPKYEIKSPEEMKPTFVNYPEIFKENLGKSVFRTIDALTKGQLGENAFLTFLSTFDEEQLATVKNINVDHTYIRLMICKIIKFLNETHTQKTSNLLNLIRKMQIVLIPNKEYYQEYVAVHNMIMAYLKVPDTGF